MDILIVTATAGEDTFTTALTKALRSLDHGVTTLGPLLAGIDPTARALARRLVTLKVEHEGETHSCALYAGRNVNGVEQVYIGHDSLIGGAEALPDGAARHVFAEAAAQLIAKEIQADVIHGIGAAAGDVLAAMAKDDSESTPAVWTPGPGDAPITAGIAQAILATRAADKDRMEASGVDMPTRLVVPGVDASVWNPLTDAHLVARFDPVDRGGKVRGKVTVQRQLTLPVRDDAPLYACVLTEEDNPGAAALVETAGTLLGGDVQLAVIVGAGVDGEQVAALEDLWDRYPDRLAIKTDADEALLHRVIAASDFCIVASEHGDYAREAMRYGSIPVAVRDAGLVSSLVDVCAELKSGNAILADDFTPASLVAACQRAAAAFTKGDAFSRLRRRAMERDTSWERAAHLFSRAYRSVVPESDAEEAA